MTDMALWPGAKARVYRVEGPDVRKALVGIVDERPFGKLNSLEGFSFSQVRCCGSTSQPKEHHGKRT